MKSGKIRKLLPLIIAGAVLAVTGCAPTYVPPDYSKYYWPQEPKRTRLRLLDIIRTDLDIRTISQTESMFGESAQFSFTKPVDIVADNEGTIYVTDGYKKAVFSINPSTGAIRTLQRPGGWISPHGLAIDNINKLLGVSDKNRVTIFDYTTGRVLRNLTGEGFRNVGDIAFDPANRLIYVVDTKASAVYKYDYSGKRLSTISEIGLGEKSVYYPSSASVDKDGRLYVADTMNWKIKIFDKEGNLEGSFGEHGSIPGQFNRPKGIAVSKDGIIAVVDTDLGFFILLNDKGMVYGYLGGIGKLPGYFITPHGIYIDDDDKIYVVDQGNRRIQIFQMYTDQYYEKNPWHYDEETGKLINSTGGESPSENIQTSEDTQSEQPAAEEPQGEAQQQ